MMPCYLLQGPWGRVTRVSCQPVAECGGTHTVQRLSAEHCSVRQDIEPKTEREGEKERERDGAVFLSLLTITPDAGGTQCHHLLPLLWAASAIIYTTSGAAISRWSSHHEKSFSLSEQTHPRSKGAKRQDKRIEWKKKKITPGVINMYGAQRQSAQSITYNKYNTV